MQELLQGDTGITALLESVTGDSPNILDATIVDANGLALLHTNPALQGTIVPRARGLQQCSSGGIRQQLRLIYGPAHAYDVRLPLINTATGKPFGEVRVGVLPRFLSRRFSRKSAARWIFPGRQSFSA